MKAVVLEEIGKPLRVANIDIPPLEFGQVLVRVLSAGICGAQLQEIDGLKGDPSHCPHLLGHEGCGIVEETGLGVKNVMKGDKVVIHWRRGSGIEAPLSEYRKPETGNRKEEDATSDVSAIRSPLSGIVKSGPCTTFSEFTIVSENRVTPIPDDIDQEFGALLGCALSTALSVAENEIKWGDNVLVIGCGGVGLAMILAAKLAHGRVTALDKFKEKEPLVQSIGADFYDNPVSIYQKFDVIIDTCGALWSEQLAPSGKYIVVGQPKKTSYFLIHPSSFFAGNGQQIKATQAGGFNPTRDIPRYVNLFRSGALDDYQKLITHRISLYQINDGIQLMRDGKAGRVMIKMATPTPSTTAQADNVRTEAPRE